MKNSGFSLIQALVFSAILSIITLTLATVITYSSRMINFIEAKINQNSLAQVVNDQLQDAATCTAALGGQPFDFAVTSTPTYPNSPGYLKLDMSHSSVPLKLYPGAPLYPTPSAMNTPNYNLDVVDLAFIQSTQLSTSAPSNGDAVYDTFLNVRLAPHKQTMGATGLAPYALTEIAVFVNAGKTIDSCQPIKKYNMSNCGTSTAIYLPTGFTTDQGISFPADPHTGCVSLSAFNGQRKGLTGPRGPEMDKPGPRGPPGPPGPKGSLIFPPPAPPPPKSDARVKSDLRDFQVARPINVEILRMQLIRTIQHQQAEIEELRHAICGGDKSCAR